MFQLREVEITRFETQLVNSNPVQNLHVEKDQLRCFLFNNAPNMTPRANNYCQRGVQFVLIQIQK